MTKVRMVCASCGGEEVVADAYAVWIEDDQKWSVTQTFEKGGYCADCDGETRIEEEQIRD